MSSPVEIEAKIGKFQTNLDRLDNIINGPQTGDGSQVVTDSGLVPTVARRLGEIPPGPEGPQGPMGPPPPIEIVQDEPEVGEDGYVYVIEGGYIAGPDGAPFIMGERGDPAELEQIPNPSDGEAYVVQGSLYVYDAGIGIWQNVGRVQGPPGPPVPVHVVQEMPSDPEDDDIYLIEGEPVDLKNIEHGSASMPAISFRDNPGVGLFMPQTGVLGISTGGIERMRIDLNGNITFSGNVTLQAPASVANANTYTEMRESGTWQKPANCTWVYVEGIGGGASGGYRTGNGGGGGAFNAKLFRAVDLPAAVAVTVGLGGEPFRSSSSNQYHGNNGGDTIFNNVSTFVAPGGKGNGQGGDGTDAGAIEYHDRYGTSDQETIVYRPGASGYSCGGGGAAGDGGGASRVPAVASRGGNSLKGGAGGGGAWYRATATGGTSIEGGNGGNGSDNGTGGDGQFPGGGGGAVYRTSGTRQSGRGGDGVLRIWTW